MIRGFALLSVLVAGTAGLAQEDLRTRFGTRGLTAAQHIDRGLTLLGSGKAAEALAAFDAALGEESDCQFAHFQRAVALGDLGRIEEAIAAYDHTYSLKGGRPTNVPIEAALNLGLTYAHLDDAPRSNLWLTRAILADPRGQFGGLGKAYRNLAVTALKQEDFLSAAACAAIGRQANPAKVEEDLVKAAMERVTPRDEVARVLTLELAECGVPAREAPSRLTPAELAGELPTEEIQELRPHPDRPLIFAFSRGKPHYYIIDAGAEPTCCRLEAAGPVQCADVAGDDLYLTLTDPPRLVRIRAADGTVLAEHALEAPAPYSVAVLPDRKEAYLAGQPHLRVLDLGTGRVRDTNRPGLCVRADTRRNLVYSYHKERGRDRTIELLIGGQPVFLQPTDTDWRQTALFQYTPSEAGLLLAFCRNSAASNGSDLVLSPDGRWVAVVGGGGWRPAGGQRGGYGIAVVCATDPGMVQGFFATGRPLTTRGSITGSVYPIGFAFNGVTNQVVAMSEDRAAVYHLANDKEPVEINGQYGGACAWAADGAWLVLALKKGGLALYSNELTDSERDRQRAPVAAASRPAGGDQAPRAAEVVAELANFAPGSDPTVARALLREALQRGRTERPPAWRDLPGYAAESAALDRILAAVPEKETGIRIYRLRQALERQSDSLPLRLALADHLRRSSQLKDAAVPALEVVHGDAGRTDLAVLALETLRQIRADQGDTIGEIHCLAAALIADRHNPAARDALKPLIAAQQWPAEAELLEKEAIPASGSKAAAKLVLADPPEGAPVLSAAEVYAQAVKAVVRVQTDEGTGSGFCIAGAGLIVTNAHVVGRHERAMVQVFELRNERIEKHAPAPARVVFRSDEEDLAVLKLTSPPDCLAPLAIAQRNPAVGQRVYAVGHPVAGTRILEQTLSEGLISAADRKLDGRTYLQHSAAIHGGSSGGPLLDDRGVVIGLVTLKADLREVGFAIPAERLRKVLHDLQD